MVSVPHFRRYAFGARWYDRLSGERQVYRLPRLTGIALLELRPGDRVLDVGCGTGLNMPMLVEAVATSGAVVGVDASAAMLDGARRRISDAGWANVSVLEGDAGDLASVLGDDTAFDDTEFDAVIFTYALSIIGDWQRAFDQAVDRIRPGGRVVVVDLALPTGRWRWLAPLARLACFTGGADPFRKPWRLVTHRLRGAMHVVLRGGHVHCASGQVAARRPGETDQEGASSIPGTFRPR